MTHDSPAATTSSEKKYHHHHAHIETLADGTTVKKYKKKKSLPDGSVVVKIRTKSTPPSSPKSNSKQSNVIKKIRTKTKRTHVDGSHTTTVIDEVITTNFSAVEPEHHVSKLPDGTEVVTLKEVKALPDGNWNVVTTMVHTVKVGKITSKQKLDTTGAFVSADKTTEIAAVEGELETPPNTQQDNVSHDISLTTFDGNQDHGPIPLEYLEGGTGSNEANDSSCFSQSLETIEGPQDAPIPSRYYEESECRSGSSWNRSVETIESQDEPLPYGYAQDANDRYAKNKVSSPSRGVGAHFVLPLGGENSDKDTKVKSEVADFHHCPQKSTEIKFKEVDFKQKRAVKKMDNCSIEPPFLDSYSNQSFAIDMYDGKSKLIPQIAGHHEMMLETLRSSDEPIPLEYTCDVGQQNATGGFDTAEKIPIYTKNNGKGNFMQRLFKVFPDTGKPSPAEKADGNISWRQSKSSSKDRNSIDMNKSCKPKKDSADENTGYNEEGLVVARRVDSSLDEPIYAAIEYDPDSKPPFYKNRRFRLYTAVLLLVFAIIVALVVVYSTKKGTEAAPKQIVYVTEAPTPRPTTDREALGINDIIEKNALIGNATFIEMKKDDPRLLALDWILHKDEMQLGISDLNLIQRYVLALLAFQFDYQGWTLCGGNNSSTDMACTVENNETGIEEEYMRWLTSTDECDWYGISCIDGKARELSLPENNLIGQIPPEISDLRYLDVLDLSHNCLFGTIPSEIASMSNIQQFNLENNGLSGYVPDELFRISTLTHLNLALQSENERHCSSSSGTLIDLYTNSLGEPNYGLEGLMLEKVKALRNLKEIRIEGNYFSGGIAPGINDLNQLAVLRAEWNSFIGSLPSELFQLTNLREMDFERNYLTGSIPENAGQAKSLEFISLFGNENMTGTIPDSLYNLANLKELWLHNNQFEGSIKSEVGNLKELVYLSLYSNEFTGTIPPELGNCEKLKWVQFQDNQINGSVPEEVCNLRTKNLYHEDPNVEVLKADCLPDNQLNAPYIQCDSGCCDTCCDHTTTLCINLEIDQRDK